MANRRSNSDVASRKPRRREDLLGAKELHKVYKAIQETMDAVRPGFVARANAELREYARTKNPLYLWRAYQCCRAVGEPLDERVLNYFDECAMRLTAIPANAGEAFEREIAKALGLKRGGGIRAAKGMKGAAGRGSFTSRFQQEREEFWAANYLSAHLGVLPAHTLRSLGKEGVVLDETSRPRRLNQEECRRLLVEGGTILGEGNKVFNRIRKLALSFARAK